SDEERRLFDAARLCLEQMMNLSVARVLNEQGMALPAGYVQRLLAKKVQIFLPPQWKAVVRHRLPARSDNALIALPTSTGKTLLGELCLVAAWGRKPGIVCYLAPYVALGRQVARTLEEHLPHSISVHRMIGGFAGGEQLRPTERQELIVATPERFDALLRTSPEIIPHLRCVVCDEAHLIGNDTRGVRLEGLLTRLRLLQQAGHGLRLVLLSAVVSRYDKLARWMDVAEDAVIVDAWRPTARRVAFWRQDGRLIWHRGDDPMGQQTADAESVLGELTLPWPQSRIRATQDFAPMRQQEPLVQANVAYLAKQLADRYGGPVLCVCATRKSTRQVALALAQRFPIINASVGKVADAIRCIEMHHQALLPLCDLLRRGVAYHNASLPHDVRRLIEDAVKAGELEAIAATTTLAEGVDLPFRFTILVDWLQWEEDGQKPMSSLLFRNVAGRCGRAGIFTEGDTIVFDNPLGDLSYTEPRHRWAIQREVFLATEPEEPTSALATFFDGTRGDAAALEAILASQFLAAIPENPNVDDLVRHFAENTFVVHQFHDDAPLHRALQGVADSLIDDGDHALASRDQATFCLTPFGKAVNATEFSPESCRRIIEVLRSVADVQDEDEVKRCAGIGALLLRELGALPEQTYRDLRKVLGDKSHRFCVKREDFEPLLAAWLAGESLENMFAALPYVQRSSRKVKIHEWLEGADEATSDWNSEFDRFADFTKAVLEVYLPWLLRACHWLAPFADERLTHVPWRQWADWIEHGVSSDWAVQALQQGAPGGRKALAVVGRGWPPSLCTESDPLGIAYIRDAVSRPCIEEVMDEA
ncbi:MAG: DEAD/DEAH box helicase, partial [Armatimonadota bacterium]|nr:DEAD/DEAH box helicase [Armatimonadota bacterium]